MKVFVASLWAFLAAAGCTASPPNDPARDPAAGRGEAADRQDAGQVPARGPAADWPQWRGPNRDGHSADTGLLKQWPEGGPKLVWKASGLGSGYASVSVVGDRLFTMGDMDDANYLIAINRADGQILWKTKVGKARRTGLGRFCRAALHADRRRQPGFRRRPIRRSALRRCRHAARRFGARTTPRISAGSCRSGASAECPWWTAKR